MPRWAADACLVLITLIWGSTFVMVQGALDHGGPITFVALRFSLGAVVLGVLFFRRLKGMPIREALAGLALGLWLALGFIFQTVGLQFTTTSQAGFITGLYVAIVPVLSFVLLRQAPGWGAALGLALSMVGLALLSLNERFQVNPGDLWVLGCAVAFALHIVAAAHYTRRFDPLRLSVMQVLGVAVIAAPAALLIERPAGLAFPADFWAAAAFTGVVATAFVLSLQVYVQKFTEASHVALIFTLEPLFAALFGWLLAGELLAARQWLGCALILAGMLIGEFWPRPAAVAALPPEEAAAH